MKALLLVACMAVVCAAIPAAADTVDLVTGTSGSLNGALFQRGDLGPSYGVGVSNVFVRVQANGTEQGYNTDGTLQFDEQNAGPVTHSVLLQDVNTVTIGGIGYYQFGLDINQPGNLGKNYISLDRVQLFTSTSAVLDEYACDGTVETKTSPECSGAATLSGLNPVFDSGYGSHVFLSYNFAGSGQGEADMFMYVPVTDFGTVTATTHVYLYSHFGAATESVAGNTDWSTTDGPEDWFYVSAGSTPVPEPASLLLLGTGLLGAGFLRRRRNR